jgi:hypothetical protein
MKDTIYRVEIVDNNVYKSTYVILPDSNIAAIQATQIAMGSHGETARVINCSRVAHPASTVIIIKKAG